MPQSPKTSLGTLKVEQNCPNQAVKLLLLGVGLYLSYKGEEFGVWIQILRQDSLEDIESAVPQALFVVTLSLIRTPFFHLSHRSPLYLGAMRSDPGVKGQSLSSAFPSQNLEIWKPRDNL